MEKIETLRMLFEVHHRQLEERRQRIHGVTQRTVAVFLVTTGWLITSKEAPVESLRWLIIASILVLASTACHVLYGHNRTYLEIARVLRRLNDAFGFFENGKYVEDQSVYEESWKSFGNQRRLTNIWHHLLIVTIMAVICVCTTLVR